MPKDHRQEDPDHDVEPHSEERPLDWLARIAPEKWTATWWGETLALEADARRVVIDPIEEETSWEEYTGTDSGERWVKQAVIDERWYVQTAAGLLFRGLEADPAEDREERSG